MLGVRPGTLARWVREGAPCVQRGRRGRGNALLIDPDAVRTWLGADTADALILELAATFPDVLATAAGDAFHLIEGPHKRATAGALAGAWFLAASAVLDHLRQRCASVGEIQALPDEVQRLQKIAKGV